MASIYLSDDEKFIIEYVKIEDHDKMKAAAPNGQVTIVQMTDATTNTAASPIRIMFSEQQLKSGIYGTHFIFFLVIWAYYTSTTPGKTLLDRYLLGDRLAIKYYLSTGRPGWLAIPDFYDEIEKVYNSPKDNARLKEIKKFI